MKLSELKLIQLVVMIFYGVNPFQILKLKKSHVWFRRRVQHLGSFPKFPYFLIMKATLTNIFGNFESQSRACSEKNSLRGKPRIGGGGENK